MRIITTLFLIYVLYCILVCVTGVPIQILGYENNQGSNFITLAFLTLASSLDPTNTGVSGLTQTLITPVSTSPSTTYQFIYPYNAQCGSAMIKFSTNSQPITNSMLMCPTPLILGVDSKPDSSTNVLSFNGNFLNGFLYGGSTKTITYTIQYGGGTTYTCTFSGQYLDPNKIYRINCKIPAPVPNPTTFKLIATTITGETSSILVAYTPTITSITKTDYKVPGIVTITGTGFTSYNLLVTIGYSPCQSPVVQEDGLQLTCEFASDVIVVDFNKPLEVVVSLSAQSVEYVDKKSIFYYNRPTPTISQCTSTVYGVPGIVTISGTYLFSTNLAVTIAGAPCTNPVASAQDGNTITCQFQSGVTVTDINNPLSVSVTIDSLYPADNNVFYYTLPTPTITKTSSTLYGTPARVTITGSGFYNFDLVVKIGGSDCKNPMASQDNNEITCDFQSDVQISDFSTPLEVSVSINTNYNANKAVFYYKQIQISIFSSTSTKYGVPATVTIYGNNFINDQLLVTIGGSKCTDALASQDNKQLTCKFQSDVVAQYNTPLDVFVSVLSQFNATKSVFLYIKSDKNCPIGSNGELCSGHGTCNQQFTCDCNKDWQSSDCSVQYIGGGVTIPEPNINTNDTSGTIITPGGTLFDVGIVLINEVDKDNNIIQSYNITSINWNNITKQDNQHIYTTTLPNNKSILNVKLSINNLNEIVYYNFAGDAIPILPKSIKYQVELQNYTFSSNLNTMQFIFKSGITQQSGNCIYESDTNTQTTSGDGSIRSILMVLNGETLIGTFSDRIVLDNRPSYNQVNKLTDTQINQYNLNSQSLYIAITTTSFQKDVIVDPNFGVLVTSKSNQDQCNKKFASWKIAVIVVCGAGVPLIIATIVILKKKRIALQLKNKLQGLNMNNL